MASSATWEVAKIKVDEFVQEHGIDETTKDEVLRRFGEIGLECLLLNYEV
jgi:hypothetical protein